MSVTGGVRVGNPEVIGPCSSSTSSTSVLERRSSFSGGGVVGPSTSRFGNAYGTGAGAGSNGGNGGTLYGPAPFGSSSSSNSQSGSGSSNNVGAGGLAPFARFDKMYISLTFEACQIPLTATPSHYTSLPLYLTATIPHCHYTSLPHY